MSAYANGVSSHLTQTFSDITNPSNNNQPTISMLFEECRNDPELCHATDARICFISLAQLYFDWIHIPIHTLYHSLFIFDCRRIALLFDDNRKPKLHKSEHFIQQLKLCSDSDFLQMIIAKDNQSHILWLNDTIDKQPSSNSDRYRIDGSDIIIDEKWNTISQWLQQFTDPITQSHYLPIIKSPKKYQERYMQQLNAFADNETWDQTFIFTQVEYCNNFKYILEALQSIECRYQYQTTMEILHQSNTTLIPMAKWDLNRLRLKTKLLQYWRKINKFEKRIDKNWITKHKFNRLRINFEFECDDGFVFIYY